MRKFLPFALLLAACAASSAQSADRIRTREGVELSVTTFVSGLEVPWSIVFTAPDRMLVSERPGRIRVVEKGVLAAKPLHVIEDVEERSESGLMGLAVAPDYTSSRHLYACYAYDAPSGVEVRIVRWKDEGDRLTGRTMIVDGIPAASNHAGCRLGFGPDGKLYATTGDATKRDLAQKMDSLAGKTLRLNPDGTIPADNPFPKSAIFSIGHRNAQGIDWHPGSGLQFQSEHGPSGFDGPGGGDEVNLVEKGKNYGWPLVHHKDTAPGTVAPLLEYTPALAPSGLAFLQGGRMASLRGSFVVAGLRGERLVRVRLDPKDPRKVDFEEDWLRGAYGRFRAVAVGPDGALYVSTSNRDGRGRARSGDDRILRIEEV
ncbi:MAG TPA: PQQ-dependent sugar dehydrogenase, partial [Thermoanaerobaculia bacterium]